MNDSFNELFSGVIVFILIMGGLGVIVDILFKGKKKSKKSNRSKSNNRNNSNNIPSALDMFIYKMKHKNKNNNQTSNTYNSSVSHNYYNEDYDNTDYNISNEDYRDKYRYKKLLSNNELKYYRVLQTIADENNLTVLSKIRMADLVSVADYSSNSWYYKYFSRIQSKHIDFALADKINLGIKILIEVDDYSHNTEKAKEKDEFKNQVLRGAGYKLLRVDNIANFDSIIKTMLEI